MVALDDDYHKRPKFLALGSSRYSGDTLCFRLRGTFP